LIPYDATGSHACHPLFSLQVVDTVHPGTFSLAASSYLNTNTALAQNVRNAFYYNSAGAQVPLGLTVSLFVRLMAQNTGKGQNLFHFGGPNYVGGM
jgi:hypothetical protein